MEKKKKGKKIVIILLVILIIAIIAVGVVLILNNKKGTKNSTTVTTKIKKSEYRMSGNSLENFDLAFLKQENEKVNKIYSPLSIKYALAMLEGGASGDSKDQITNVIGDYNPNKYTNSANMSLANAIFIKDTYKDSIKEDYINKLQDKFGAEVKYDSFASPDNVNSWISEKTLKLIDNMLSEIDPEQRFLLINALGIDMDWNEKFLLGNGLGVGVHYAHEKFYWSGPSHITPKTFNGTQEVAGMKIIASLNNYDIVKELGEANIRKTVDIAYREYLADPNNKWELNGDESVEHINKIISSYLDSYIPQINSNYKSVDKTTEFSLYVDDDVKAFAKDLKEYDGTTLQYVAVMPLKDNLDTFVNKTDAKELNKIISSLKELNCENFKDGVVTKITGFIPKFKFDYDLDLIKDLKELGITDVFEPSKANLSKISTEKGMYINDAKHKANIEFTQDGIKASAASIMGGAGAGGSFDYLFDVPVEEIDLTFDKPYMFIIRDKKSGEVWFTGTVYNPLDWKNDPDYNPNYKEID